MINCPSCGAGLKGPPAGARRVSCPRCRHQWQPGGGAGEAGDELADAPFVLVDELPADQPLPAAAPPAARRLPAGTSFAGASYPGRLAASMLRVMGGLYAVGGAISLVHGLVWLATRFDEASLAATYQVVLGLAGLLASAIPFGLAAALESLGRTMAGVEFLCRRT